jgi:hypothetical protein
MDRNDRPVTLTQAHLETLLEAAAEAGAKKALRAIGLHDEQAADDVRELRGVLDAWRAAKTTAWNTVVRAITIAVLAALIAGAAVNVWNKAP